MNTIFIINPKAGDGKAITKLISAIKAIPQKPEIYLTKGIADATYFVKNYCEKFGPARFIACGGDGTFSEVLNGAILFENSEVGVLPIGTGNDFCRNFNKACLFSSPYFQTISSTEKCDAIYYEIETNGKEICGYCANMFNIGFDANVADLTSEIKKKPFLSGSFAYFISILINLIKKKGANLRIDLDGKTYHNGPLLLTSVANGSFCGGGIKSNPLANINNGFINVNIIKNISRINFLTKLPFYMRGTHIHLKNIEQVIFSANCKEAIFSSLDKEMKICVDGEMITAEKIKFKIIHNAYNFVIPKDC